MPVPGLTNDMCYHDGLGGQRERMGGVVAGSHRVLGGGGRVSYCQIARILPYTFRRIFWENCFKKMFCEECWNQGPREQGGWATPCV